jgi:hypothetical protein
MATVVREEMSVDCMIDDDDSSSIDDRLNEGNDGNIGGEGNNGNIGGEGNDGNSGVEVDAT